MRTLGIDTSNYTTSAAVFDGRDGYNAGRLLEVRSGELGLRQSDALFQHVKHLPERFAELHAAGWLDGLAAVGASTRPRAVEGSYMPCFLAGEGQGRALADVLGVPFYAVSHQQGHVAAAAWSAGRMELLDGPMLAWHCPAEPPSCCMWSRRGGTSGRRKSAAPAISPPDSSLTAPACCWAWIPGGGPWTPWRRRAARWGFSVKLNDLTFSLSGMENKVKAWRSRGAPAEIARFALETVASTVRRATDAAKKRSRPAGAVLRRGGIQPAAARVMADAAFAEPRYSTDNALGAAILALGPEREGRHEHRAHLQRHPGQPIYQGPAGSRRSSGRPFCAGGDLQLQVLPLRPPLLLPQGRGGGHPVRYVRGRPPASGSGRRTA